MASVGASSGKTISLNLNPMLDVFSILITFLLMSFSTDPVNYEINSGVELPQSKTLVSLDEIPTIVVSRTDILVNDKKITTIINGDVPEQDRSQGAIYPLFTELQKLAENNKRLRGGKDDQLGSLTLEMDKDHRFKLLKRVMLSSQQAKFITFKLMVAKDQN